ncbi:hypothetical protein MMC07_005955 [Pseudocyphellaria aurata]|nr:hypothetical protein [Pseudocyphellaria aurata]
MERLHLTSKEKRRSLTSALSSPVAKINPKNNPRAAPVVPATLDIDYESPPLVFYGSAIRSSGALLSGQLEITVLEPEIVLKEFEMVLLGTVAYKKPAIKDCPDCSIKRNELKEWIFITEPVRYTAGKYSFPFSYLLPGHLPTTSHSPLGSIEYELRAEAHTNFKGAITFTRKLTVQRALQPGSERISTRLFPPTNILTRVVLPATIHPIGQFLVQIRVSGIVKDISENMQQRWRVQKLSWRIEEYAHIISPACPKHQHKLALNSPAPGNSKNIKGVLHHLPRELAHGESRGGWKTDYAASQTELELSFSIGPSSRPVCDVKSATGLTVEHAMVLEIVLAEEQLMGKNMKFSSLTGVARVLKMKFGVVMTERSGMGISWDEEQPPIYEDVPVSPPGYTALKEHHDEPIPYEGLSRLEDI